MAGLSSKETPVDDRQPGQISSPGSTTPRDVTGPDKPTQMTTRRWRAFALLVVAYFMTIVDLTIVNVALPTIGLKLHFAQSDLQWLVTAYGLTFGGFLLLGGRAADLLGRRRMLMVGLASFGLFLARHLIEAWGGTLRLDSWLGGWAVGFGRHRAADQPPNHPTT